MAILETCRRIPLSNRALGSREMISRLNPPLTRPIAVLEDYGKGHPLCLYLHKAEKMKVSEQLCALNQRFIYDKVQVGWRVARGMKLARLDWTHLRTI